MLYENIKGILNSILDLACDEHIESIRTGLLEINTKRSTCGIYSKATIVCN